MVELADIFRSAGPAYRRAHQDRMPPSHLQAMQDIVLCRTPALGGSLYACDDCGALDYAYHSCRNRHCPKCQEDRAQAWLQRLTARLLPCDHYLLTFTLPAALRSLARSHQRLLYSMLLREAAATLQTLTDDRTWVGGRLGILAVLHTWSRSLAYHPHVHLLATAGALSTDGSAWLKPAHSRFLVPGYVLSKLFRTRMHAACARAGLLSTIEPHVWDTSWIVHVQQIGTGQRAALYLSRYVFRVALTNQRIERFENGHVTFRYTHAQSHQTRRCTLPVHHFIARFLQHVLPRRFAKIRYYGLLSPSYRDDLACARRLLAPSQPALMHHPPSDTPSDSGAPPSSAHSPAPAHLTTASASLSPRRCPLCHRGHLSLLLTSRPSRAPP